MNLLLFPSVDFSGSIVRNGVVLIYFGLLGLLASGCILSKFWLCVDVLIIYSFPAVAVVEWLGINEATLMIGGLTLAIGSYLVSMIMSLHKRSIEYTKVPW